MVGGGEEDVTSIWLRELDLTGDYFNLVPTSSPSAPSIKQEDGVTSTPQSTPSLRSDSLPTPLLTPSPSLYYPNSPTPHTPPLISASLVLLLSPPTQPNITSRRLNALESLLALHPFLVGAGWKARVESGMKWAREMGVEEEWGAESLTSPRRAREILYGGVSKRKESGGGEDGRPSVSFYACMAGALALGALVDRELHSSSTHNHTSSEESSTSSTTLPPPKKLTPTSSSSSSRTKRPPIHTPDSRPPHSTASPSVLFAISEQALDIYERSAGKGGGRGCYDLDYVRALILRGLWMIYGGGEGGGGGKGWIVDWRLYPLVSGFYRYKYRRLVADWFWCVVLFFRWEK